MNRWFGGSKMMYKRLTNYNSGASLIWAALSLRVSACFNAASISHWPLLTTDWPLTDHSIVTQLPSALPNSTNPDHTGTVVLQESCASGKMTARCALHISALHISDLKISRRLFKNLLIIYNVSSLGIAHLNLRIMFTSMVQETFSTLSQCRKGFLHHWKLKPLQTRLSELTVHRLHCALLQLSNGLTRSRPKNYK